MRLLMIGAGATGGYFGGRLAQAGRDVTFLVRERRGEQLRQNGLQISSPLGDFDLRPAVVSAQELRDREPFDLILVSTKAYSLDAAMNDFAPAMGPSTLILPMLNGMRHLDILDRRFGAEHVLGGSVRIVADMGEDGDIEQGSRLGELAFGARRSTAGEPIPQARVEEVARELGVPGFDLTVSPDILGFMWQKWWILASIGALCVLARGNVGQSAEAPFGPETARAIVAECTAIAAANGYAPDPAMLAGHKARLTEAGSTLTSSMYRDMLKGFPVEADHILGDLLERRGDVPAPLLMAAYMQLSIYDEQRRIRNAGSATTDRQGRP